MADRLSDEQIQQMFTEFKARQKDGTLPFEPSLSQVHATAEETVTLLKGRFYLPTQRQAGYVIGVVAMLTAVNAFLGYGMGSWAAAGKLNEKGVQDKIAMIDGAAARAKKLQFIDVPVGSIIAWHKNPNPDDRSTGLHDVGHDLPGEWLECNEHLLPEDSPLRKTGATHTPKLNEVDGYDGGRFLRGSDKSGIEQGATGTWRSGNRLIWGGTSPPGVDGNVGFWESCQWHVQPPEGKVVKGSWGAVRPINMSVVWIIRVK